MPEKTTDKEFVEAVGKLGDAVYALTHNVIKLETTLSAMTEKLDALIEKPDKRS